MAIEYSVVSQAGFCWLIGIGLVIGVAAARLVEGRGYEFYFKWPFRLSLRKKE